MTPYTTFNDLLTLTREYIVKGLSIPDERAFRSMKKVGTEIGFKADSYIILRPGGGQVDAQWSDSEGRLATAVTRELIVEPYYRLALDNITTNNLVAQALLAREDNIVSLLQNWEPEKALEPFHWLGVAPETAEPQATRGWAWSSLRFSVKFLQVFSKNFL